MIDLQKGQRRFEIILDRGFWNEVIFGCLIDEIIFNVGGYKPVMKMGVYFLELLDEFKFVILLLQISCV